MKTALILPGGGSKGALEVGAAKVIFKKLIPDIIIGTSVGALNGVLLAKSKKNYEENIKHLEKIWLNATRKTFFPHNPNFFVKFHHAESFYSNKGIYNQLKQNVDVSTFEELEIPLYVNCTDMGTGKTKYFSKGKLFDAIVASCSVPPFFPPVYIGGTPFIDGSIGSFFGIKEAVRLKCNQVIIVNTRFFNKYNIKKNNLAEYTNHAATLIEDQLMRDEIELCKANGIEVIEIKPKIRNLHITDFRFTKELIEEGEKSAKYALRKLRT